MLFLQSGEPSCLLQMNVLALKEGGAQGVKQGYLPSINTGKKCSKNLVTFQRACFEIFIQQ